MFKLIVSGVLWLLTKVPLFGKVLGWMSLILPVAWVASKGGLGWHLLWVYPLMCLGLTILISLAIVAGVQLAVTNQAFLGMPSEKASEKASEEINSGVLESSFESDPNRSIEGQYTVRSAVKLSKKELDRESKELGFETKIKRANSKRRN